METDRSLKWLAVLVIAATVLAGALPAEAKLFDFNPWWPGWDMAWWH